MKTWIKVLIVTLVFGTIAFMTGSNTPVGEKIWPPSPDNHTPEGAQLALLMTMGAVEALAFGLGVAFIAWGWPLVKRFDVGPKGLAIATYLSISWLLVNWYPHTNLHIANGLDLWGLIGIEYGFHLTLVIAGLIVAMFFLRVLQQTPETSLPRAT
ncbi:MAG: hypothetical protein KY455_09025 [Euryarchaeota archaeon]|nr:hypothetical protein [Euryarchaeota archaeon]